MEKMLDEVFLFWTLGRPMSQAASWFMIVHMIMIPVGVGMFFYYLYKNILLAADNYRHVGLIGIPYGLIGSEARYSFRQEKVIDVSDVKNGVYLVSTTDGERQKRLEVVVTKEDPLSDEYRCAERFFKKNEEMYERVCPNAWVRFRDLKIIKEGGEPKDVYVIYMRHESPAAVEKLLNEYFEKEAALHT
jgi:hypothetical protein